MTAEKPLESEDLDIFAGVKKVMLIKGLSLEHSRPSPHHRCLSVRGEEVPAKMSSRSAPPRQRCPLLGFRTVVRL